MKRNSILGIILCLMLAVCLLQGCASTQQGKEAEARTIAFAAGLGVCAVRPDIALQVLPATKLVAGDYSSLSVFEQWIAQMAEHPVIQARIQDLMILMQDEGIIDTDFNVNVAEVTGWMRMMAQAMSEGLSMCAILEKP